MAFVCGRHPVGTCKAVPRPRPRSQADRSRVSRISQALILDQVEGPDVVLVAYESRLRSARTWPYDTAMLRTLFLSVVVPGGAAGARVLSQLLFQ